MSAREGLPANAGQLVNPAQIIERNRLDYVTEGGQAVVAGDKVTSRARGRRRSDGKPLTAFQLAKNSATAVLIFHERLNLQPNSQNASNCTKRTKSKARTISNTSLVELM
jgi:hypothetical protein